MLVCSSDPDHPASNVKVTGGLFGSSGVALKIGSLTAAPIREVTFENCEVFDSSRAFAIETRHPVARVERVVWRNIRASVMPDSEGEGGDLISIRAVEGGGSIELTGCEINGVTATLAPSANFSAMETQAGLALRNVHFLTQSN
jgi:hypothetical protein